MEIKYKTNSDGLNEFTYLTDDLYYRVSYDVFFDILTNMERYRREDGRFIIQYEFTLYRDGEYVIRDWVTGKRSYFL